MSEASSSKRKNDSNIVDMGIDVFVDAHADNADESDDDSSDSEESVYSGLEEEESDDSSDESGDDEADVGDGAGSEEPETLGTVSNEEGSSTSVEKSDDHLPGSCKAQTQIERPDEYEYDSSDEEDIRNTVGNIPIEWYREFDHLGYDWDGKMIGKPKVGDKLDDFLDKMENPDYWRTVLDTNTGQNVVLSEADVDLVQRLQGGKYVDSNYDPYEPWLDFFTHETMIHPVTNRPEHKRSFTPSHLDRLKVGKMVHAIKMGWMKPSSVKKLADDKETFYNLWDQEGSTLSILQRHRQHIPAPKMPLPGHAESYNPPPEYVPDKDEIAKWESQEPEERKLNFIPQSYSRLRHVPAYQRFINERFERCLDLYLCPRQRKMRMNVNPEDLLPRLPKPQDLQPFPSTQAVVYTGHTSLVRCISVDPNGQWFASGSDDGTIKLWEIATGRCMRTIAAGDVVRGVAWSPNPSLCLLAVAIGCTVHVLNPRLGDRLVTNNTDNMLAAHDATPADPSKVSAEWSIYEGGDYEAGWRIRICQQHKVEQVTWHARGDYLASVMPDAGHAALLIHQISKRRSQRPFNKSKGLVQRVLFHPSRPFLFVATQRYIRVYNLLKQEMTKKLMTNVKWLSCLAVHPGGDNLVIGSYDTKTSWFDLDLTDKPYHTLKHHKRAVRQVAVHRCYPLFASSSDDGTTIVCHGCVYNDMLQNPLIVPVKVLRGHTTSGGLGVLDCAFHPSQPWILTAGADHTVRLFS